MPKNLLRTKAHAVITVLLDQLNQLGFHLNKQVIHLIIKNLTHITAMGELAIKMVRESVNSFINNDEALADEVIALDDQMASSPIAVMCVKFLIYASPGIV